MSSLKNFSVNNKSRKWPKFLIGAGLLVAILFILNVFVAPIRNSFLTMSGGIQKTFWSAGESSSGFFGVIFKSGNLAQENENLKNQNQILLSQVAALQSIEQGNLAQSSVSAACQNSGFTLLMAGVTGLDKDILSISKGSADGITEGMPVINQQNVLVGKILKVYKNYSEIMLASSKNSVINVKVLQSDATLPEIDGVVKGDGGLNAHLDLVPINSKINPNDILVTSSLEKSFPKDLLLGKIIQKKSNDQQPFQQAQISLFFDVKTADNLFVITNYKR